MNDEWQTPDDLYLTLHKEFGFEFDLCANEDNSKCEVWTDCVEDFAVTTDVRSYETYWMNPPYSRGNISLCMSSAVTINGEGKMVVCLVRFDPSAKWFQHYVDGYAAEVRMMERRVKFIGASSAYNFPTCIVVYDGSRHRNTEYFMWGW